MIDFNTYSLFFATALILVITPGPDTILVVSRSDDRQDQFRQWGGFRARYDIDFKNERIIKMDLQYA